MGDDPTKIVSGFEFDKNQEFNDHAVRIMEGVQESGIATFEIDDSPEGAATVAQLQKVSGEYFELVQIDHHKFGVIDLNTFDVPQYVKRCHKCGAVQH